METNIRARTTDVQLVGGAPESMSHKARISGLCVCDGCNRFVSVQSVLKNESRTSLNIFCLALGSWLADSLQPLLHLRCSLKLRIRV